MSNTTHSEPPENADKMPGFAFIMDNTTDFNIVYIDLVFILHYDRSRQWILYRFIDNDEDDNMRLIEGFNIDDEIQHKTLKRKEIFFLPSEYNTILRNFRLPAAFWEFPIDFSGSFHMFPENELQNIADDFAKYREIRKRLVEKMQLKKEMRQLKKMDEENNR